MDILSSLNKLFSKDNKGRKEVQKIRREAKERFAQQLIEQCFMTDDEVISVMDVIDECMDEIDDFQEKFDFSEINFRNKNAFETELIKLRKNLIDKTKAKINEIMHLKLERAKKILRK